MNFELSISCECSLMMCLQLHSLHIRDDSQDETVKYFQDTSLILFCLTTEMVPSGFRITQEFLCSFDYLATAAVVERGAHAQSKFRCLLKVNVRSTLSLTLEISPLEISLEKY